MASFKDLPLQTSYEDSWQNLERKFFGLVLPTASVHKIFTRSLDTEALRLAAIGASSFLRDGHEVRILVSPSAPIDLDSATESRRELLSVAGSIENSCNVDDLATRIKVRTTTNSESLDAAAMPADGTVGILVDEAGNLVVYNADASNVSTTQTSMLSVSWSWGDPQFRAATTARRYDLLWNSLVNVEASKEFVIDVARKLLSLEKAQAESPNPQFGIALYGHQRQAVEAWLSGQCRGVFMMCTGAGKTVSALECIRRIASQRIAETQDVPPVVVSVPTKVLADQWIAEIRRFGFRSVLAAYNTFDQWNQMLEPVLRNATRGQPRFVVTTYRTLGDYRFVAKSRRVAETGVRAVWIADEMHNLASPRLRAVMDKLGPLFPFRLGLSATPEIEGDLAATEHLLAYFGGIVASYELADGIRDGVLCPYTYFPTPAYLSPELGERYLGLLRQIDQARLGSAGLIEYYRESRELIRTSGVQVEAFRLLLQGLVDGGVDLSHTLVYSPPGFGMIDREESDEVDTDAEQRRLIEEVISIIRESGFSVSSILGETPADQRAEILKRFGDGRLDVLCAIGCLDEGVDVPSIQRAIVLYSIDREKQFIQRRGRILRKPRDGREKLAEIYDIVVLPQRSHMSESQSTTLLNKELRRYHQFAQLATNRSEADQELERALSLAIGTT